MKISTDRVAHTKAGLGKPASRRRWAVSSELRVCSIASGRNPRLRISARCSSGMFIALKDTLVEGGEVPVTLTFEKAGSIDTFLHVLGLGARGPEAGHPHDGAGQ